MNNERFSVGTGAILLAALIYFVADLDKILALLVPVLVHELGHVFTIRLLGLRINGFRVELKGFCIRYCGYTGAMGHALAAAAGPLGAYIRHGSLFFGAALRQLLAGAERRSQPAAVSV